MTPSQLEDTVTALESRCQALETAWKEKSAEARSLRLAVLDRDHLLGECRAPLELLRVLAHADVSAEHCAGLLQEIQARHAESKSPVRVVQFAEAPSE